MEQEWRMGGWVKDGGRRSVGSWWKNRMKERKETGTGEM